MKIIILMILVLTSSSNLSKIDKIYIYFDGYSCISCQPGIVFAFGSLSELGLGDKIILVNKHKKEKYLKYNLKLIKENSNNYIVKNISNDTTFTNNMDYFKPILIKLNNNKQIVIERNGVPYTKEKWSDLLVEKLKN